MKNEYSKNSSKGYQASPNKPTDNTRKAPTQGGSTLPGGQGKGGFDQTKTSQNQNQNPNQKTNNWGTGSIDKNKDKGDRR